MVKLVDAPDLESGESNLIVGSTPTFGTIAELWGHGCTKFAKINTGASVSLFAAHFRKIVFAYITYSKI